jgi:hypothetical protein
MALVASGRLEYIPTVAPASPPAVPEASRFRDNVSWVFIRYWEWQR